MDLRGHGSFLEETQGSGAQAPFHLFPVPYEQTTTYLQGCERGPRAVLDASWNVEMWDEDAERELSGLHFHTHPPFDAAPPPDRLPEALRSLLAPRFREGRCCIVLGGEHAVSLGPVLAARDAHPGLCVLQLDAHADLRDAYEGSPFSHACVARRIQEHVPLVQAGIRSLSAAEARDRGRLNVRTFLRKDMDRIDAAAAGRVVDALGDPVYLTVDIDAFDPAFAPGTGTPEPGGLDWFEVSTLVRTLATRRRIVGFDVTELKPIPGDIRTEFLAARLILRLAAWILRSREAEQPFHLQ